MQIFAVNPESWYIDAIEKRIALKHRPKPRVSPYRAGGVSRTTNPTCAYLLGYYWSYYLRAKRRSQAGDLSGRQPRPPRVCGNTSSRKKYR